MRENGRDGAQTVFYDLVGVGFGPSNLALAVAIGEHNERAKSGRGNPAMSATFLERQARFGWHRGMLIDDATMQVSFMKDLVTLRNPVSHHSFIAYLAAKGRLIDFINHKTFYPSRVEFHDYLDWVAGQFAHMVEYSSNVVNVCPVRNSGTLEWLDVIADRDDGKHVVRRARNVVLAPGLRPVLPPGINSTDHVWHSAELITRLERIPRGLPHQFVVVGAGQSAAEVVGYLHRRFDSAQVHAVFARYGYSIADDTPFANRIFDPAAVDDFYDAPPTFKDQLFAYHSNTNYSVVDADLIADLYARMYRERVTGNGRLHFHNSSAVLDQAEVGDRLRLTIRHLPTGQVGELLADYVVYATGYAPADPGDILGEAAALCHKDAGGRLTVGRDYQVNAEPDSRCGVYLQGCTAESHGISSSLLSNIAVRAGQILDSINRRAASADPRASLAVSAVDAGKL